MTTTKLILSAMLVCITAILQGCGGGSAISEVNAQTLTMSTCPISGMYIHSPGQIAHVATTTGDMVSVGASTTTMREITFQGLRGNNYKINIPELIEGRVFMRLETAAPVCSTFTTSNNLIGRLQYEYQPGNSAVYSLSTGNAFSGGGVEQLNIYINVNQYFTIKVEYKSSSHNGQENTTTRTLEVQTGSYLSKTQQDIDDLMQFISYINIEQLP